VAGRQRSPDPAAAAKALIGAALDTPIDPTARVPLRIVMIRDSASSLQAPLVSHHVAMDATGLLNFAAHVLADYESITATGNPAPMPSTSFIDCLELERAYRESAQWSADCDCLIDQLRGVTPAMFDRSTSGAAPAPVRHHRSWLDRSFVNRLREKDISFVPYLCAIVGTEPRAEVRRGDHRDSTHESQQPDRNDLRWRVFRKLAAVTRRRGKPWQAHGLGGGYAASCPADQTVSAVSAGRPDEGAPPRQRHRVWAVAAQIGQLAGAVVAPDQQMMVAGVDVALGAQRDPGPRVQAGTLAARLGRLLLPCPAAGWPGGGRHGPGRPRWAPAG
jgi:hypothetical protein